MIKKLIFNTLLCLAILTSIGAYGQENYSKVKIFIENNTLGSLATLGIDVTEGYYRKNVYLETDLPNSMLRKLEEQNITYEILIPDVKKYYVERSEAEQNYRIPRNINDQWPVPDHFEMGSMGGYYTLEEAMAELDEMHALYPDLISARLPISTDTLTHDANMLYWVKISNHPDVNEDEPEVLYTALHHAREPVSIEVLIYYMWYILENYSTQSDISFLVDNTEMYFIPVVNPDGYEYNRQTDPNGGGMWRKNRSDNGDGSFGVDINRNYSYMWGFDDEGSSPFPDEMTYRGSSPMSEPEIRNMRQFCAEHEFQIALNYHSYSNLLLFPWGYHTDISPDHELMNEFAHLMTKENSYVYGPASTTIYPTNGDSNDWMYGDEIVKDKTYAFVPEVGGSSDGFWPVRSRIIPLCQENMWQTLMAAKLLLHYARVTNISPIAVTEINGYAAFDLKRLGLAEGGIFTVSIAALDDNIQTVGAPIEFSNLELLEAVTDSISYSLTPDIEPGTVFKYVLIVDNGQFLLRDTISHVFGTEVEIIHIDFEDNSFWVSDTWGITEVYSHSPYTSITDSPLGNYQNNANSSLYFDTIVDLTGAKAAFLRFWARWEIEAGYDYLQVMVKGTNQNTWSPLSGNYTHIGNENQVAGQPLFDGIQNDWIFEEMNLAEMLDNRIELRFMLVTDQNERADGFYFDDLTISVVSPVTGEVETPTTDYRDQLKLFPNPANELVTVAFNGLKTQQNQQLVIVDASGRLLSEISLEPSSQPITLSVDKLQPGFYYVGIKSGKQLLSATKLVVY